jgi:cyclin T
MNKLMNELVQYSMSFANDSMHTSLCLQFTPQLIATACVFLACQFAKVEPVSPTGVGDWRKILGDPDIESLASISIQIMDLVAERKASDTDTFRKIRAQLELLKSREDTGSGGGGIGNKSPPPPPPSDQPNAKRPRVG